MESTVKFSVPILTISLNKLLRMHYNQRSSLASEWRSLILIHCPIPVQPIVNSKIIITRYSSRSLDWDNLYASFKVLLDTLVVPTKRNPHGLSIIYDDSPKYLIELVGKQEKCKRGDEHTVVEIFDMLT